MADINAQKSACVREKRLLGLFLIICFPPYVTANIGRESGGQVCHIVSRDPAIAIAFTLAQEFGKLLRQRQGGERLEQWKTAVRSSGITELIRFVDGLADDEVAVANACTESWSNGMVEGFNNKVKLIKCSFYGYAGFPLLQRRVLLTGRCSA